MKKTHRALPRIFWIFSLCLALLPFSTSAVEIRSLLRYAVILAHRSNFEPSAQDAARRYRTAMNAQEERLAKDGRQEGCFSLGGL